MLKSCRGQLKGVPDTQGPWRFGSQQGRFVLWFFFLNSTIYDWKEDKASVPQGDTVPRGWPEGTAEGLWQPHAPRSGEPGEGFTETRPSPTDSHSSASSRAHSGPGHPVPPPWGGWDAAPALKMAARLQCLRRALKPRGCWLRWRLLTWRLRAACPRPTWLPLPYCFLRQWSQFALSQDGGPQRVAERRGATAVVRGRGAGLGWRRGGPGRGEARGGCACRQVGEKEGPPQHGRLWGAVRLAGRWNGGSGPARCRGGEGSGEACGLGGGLGRVCGRWGAALARRGEGDCRLRGSSPLCAWKSRAAESRVALGGRGVPTSRRCLCKKQYLWVVRISTGAVS